jgi:hypothetical protein
MHYKIGTRRTDMKRLTDKTDYVLGVYSDMEERLMDIEDILGDEYDLDRLRELAQADKEDRVLPEGSGWFVTCSGKKLTVVMDIEAALRREQDG